MWDLGMESILRNYFNFILFYFIYLFICYVGFGNQFSFVNIDGGGQRGVPLA